MNTTATRTRSIAPPVLIVDDDPGVREALVEALAARGADVTTAADVEQAASELGRHRFALVLTDLRLPGGDGLTVARAASKAAARPRVVLFSGYELDQIAADAEAAGVDELVAKPFPPDVLDRLLEEIGVGEPELPASGGTRLRDEEGQALLERFALGERQAFERLVDAYTPMLYAIFLRWFSLRVDEADDLYQEVLLQLTIKAATIRNVRHWLVGTAVNQAKKRIRRHVRDRNLTRQYLDELGDDGTIEEPDVSGDGVRDLVTKALGLLSDKDRELLTLLFLDELSYQEIAARLGRSVGSIGPLRARALKRLEHAIAGLEQLPNPS